MKENLSSKITFLISLYYLQGVLTGLFQSLQLIISELNATYFEQGLFYSTSSFPGTIKLFWAPLIDTHYWHRIGRKKS